MTKESQDIKYPLISISIGLVVIYCIAILFAKDYERDFWMLAKYTYMYSWSSCFSVYLLYRLNKEYNQSKLKTFFWCSFISLFIAIPIFLIKMTYAIWTLYPDWFFVWAFLGLLGIVKLLGFKLFGGYIFAGNSSTPSTQNTPRSYTSGEEYMLKRFNGTTWYTVMRGGSESILFHHMEIEQQKDIENGNYKTKYKVVDSQGRMVG